MVTDSHGEPIPGASIIVKGTRTGTSTNIEGEFTLDVKSDKVVLEVFYRYEEANCPSGCYSSENG